jgi:hypothetical protein
MFLIDIHFKSCQGRSNRSSIVHAVSIVFAYHRCFAYDFHFSKLFENLFVHAVSITPHNSSQIRIHIRKGFSPLIRGPGRMF